MAEDGFMDGQRFPTKERIARLRLLAAQASVCRGGKIVLEEDYDGCTLVHDYALEETLAFKTVDEVSQYLREIIKENSCS